MVWNECMQNKFGCLFLSNVKQIKIIIQKI